MLMRERRKPSRRHELEERLARRLRHVRRTAAVAIEPLRGAAVPRQQKLYRARMALHVCAAAVPAPGRRGPPPCGVLWSPRDQTRLSIVAPRAGSRACLPCSRRVQRGTASIALQGTRAPSPFRRGNPSIGAWWSCWTHLLGSLVERCVAVCILSAARGAVRQPARAAGP